MKRDGVSLSTSKRTAKGKTYRYWALRWFDPATGKRRSQNIGTVADMSKRKAERLRQLKQVELEKSPARRSQSPTLGNLLAEHIASCRASGVRRGTISSYEQVGRLLTTYFGEERAIDSIMRLDVEGFIRALLGGELDAVSKSTQRRRASDTTVGKYLRTARAAFGWAVELDLIDANPFATPRSTRGRKRAGQVSLASKPKDWQYVPMAVFWRLHDAAPARWRMILALARMAALRRSDIEALTWDNVDLEGREIRFTAYKTGAKVVVPISPTLCELLVKAHAQRASYKLGDDHVVDWSDVTLNNIGRDVAVMCQRAEIDPYGDPLHTLRKSCIQDWARRHPMHAVHRWAGHSTITTTLAYYTCADDSELDAAKADDMFGRKTDANSDANSSKTGVHDTAIEGPSNRKPLQKRAVSA